MDLEVQADRQYTVTITNIVMVNQNRVMITLDVMEMFGETYEYEIEFPLSYIQGKDLLKLINDTLYSMFNAEDSLEQYIDQTFTLHKPEDKSNKAYGS